MEYRQSIRDETGERYVALRARAGGGPGAGSRDRRRGADRITPGSTREYALPPTTRGGDDRRVIDPDAFRSLPTHVRRLYERLRADCREVEAARAAEMEGVLDEVTQRLSDEHQFPFCSSLYAGQMLKPPHPVAHLAYTLAQTLNPNAHALDGGPAASAMEKEAVAELAALFGWRDRHLGHLTGGGTIANLEALWVGAETMGRDRAVLASSLAHYTHERLCGVLDLPFESVPVDAHGRLDVAALRSVLERRSVGTVVATLGTTGLGAVDPLPELLELRERHGFRLHVDAAYGGFFGLVGDALDPTPAAAFARIGEADSIVVDPHKHGLQPYGCGCILFRDPDVGRVYRHDSPYTYFTSAELHLGEISLECSRPGAAAVALWATQRLLPYTPDGDFAAGLRSCLRAARGLHQSLAARPEGWRTLAPPTLDIVVWAPRIGAGASASTISAASRSVYSAAAERGLHLALMRLDTSWLGRQEGFRDVVADAETVTCLRSTLMKPEHDGALPKLVELLDDAASAVFDVGG
jgi:tyrosine decarboxylase/aspartate 1-decarboxylase